MKAVVLTRYGPPHVLQLQEVERPSPKQNELLIRSYATTVTAGDCEVRGLKFPLFLSIPMQIWLGFGKPRSLMIPGTELAGEVVATGKDVTLFKEGDQVFGSMGLSFGACAEYTTAAEAHEGPVLALKPTNMSYEEAATVTMGGLNALHFLREGKLQSGQKLLINGAGGAIGAYALQLGKYFGAEVTCVDHTAKLDMLRSIGADHVIDYTQGDFTKQGEKYDLIFDVVGKSPFSRSLDALKPNGRYLLGNPHFSDFFRAPLKSMGSDKKVITTAASYRTEDLIFLKELIEAGKIKAVIDRRYPLEQIVEAHTYVETGLKKGNVVITIG